MLWNKGVQQSPLTAPLDLAEVSAQGGLEQGMPRHLRIPRSHVLRDTKTQQILRGRKNKRRNSGGLGEPPTAAVASEPSHPEPGRALATSSP